MTHTEGVLKKFEVLNDNEDNSRHTLFLEFTDYGGQKHEIGVELEDVLKRVLTSEKISVVTYVDEGCEDWVSVRGVFKAIPLTVRYTNNF